jgi:hypothetical protein
MLSFGFFKKLSRFFEKFSQFYQDIIPLELL